MRLDNNRLHPPYLTCLCHHTRFEKHMCARLLSIANGRAPLNIKLPTINADLLPTKVIRSYLRSAAPGGMDIFFVIHDSEQERAYIDCLLKFVLILYPQLNDEEFEVKSSTDNHRVNMSLGYCTCCKGRDGSLCDHQCSILLNFESSETSFRCDEVRQKTRLFWLATGTGTHMPNILSESNRVLGCLIISLYVVIYSQVWRLKQDGVILSPTIPLLQPHLKLTGPLSQRTLRMSLIKACRTPSHAESKAAERTSHQTALPSLMHGT